MHSRVLRLRSAWLLLPLVAACLSPAPRASAQQVTRSSEPVFIAPELPPAPSIEAVLAEGTRLETLGRWGEALSHYEDALRQHPGEATLEAREDAARLHYSLDRRYCDHSFLQSLDSLTPQQAGALYLELARKINAHYVVEPPWQRLAARGATAVDMALGQPGFCAANRVSPTAEHRSSLRRELYQLTANRLIAGPNDLAALAAEAAQLAERRCGLRQSAVLLEFITAAAGGLDEYSTYLTADQLRDVYSQIEGNFVGLGVELKADRGALLIVHVIGGSPAQRAGIKDNDRITAVDGRSTAKLSTDEAAALLTGEEGSYVRVQVESAGLPPRELNVRREHVEVPSLEDVAMVDAAFAQARGLNLTADQLAAGVAYVKIPAFQKTTSRDLDAALWDLHAKGMKTLVLDLRGNPGGLLTAAVEVADKFLMQGNIVSTRGRSAQEDFNYQAHYGGTWRVPLAVLIDGDSASASEIFAGAIKDNGRGVIVGQKSYGKGSVQGIFPLGYAGAGVRLTTALFYAPSGQKIAKQGVTPQQIVAGPYRVARPVDGGSELKIVGTDPVLDAGIQAAVDASKQRVAAR
ncbi:MAG: S41 family peptidase [Pirellulales bacterium]|nr:S41 family peptidase [Pirellulales bacterium]